MDVFGLPGPNRCRVMGILNVTPDSFSDGGMYLQIAHAIKRGEELAAEGADIIDVGGESTRPGARRTSEADELERVVPVVQELVQAGLHVSIDTMRASVADAALRVGAHIVNDVSGGLADPAMSRVVASADVPYIAMHWRAHSLKMSQQTQYDDVCATVRDELRDRLHTLVSEGISADRIVLDPGLGYSKTAQHNWTILSHLHEFESLGCPMMIGASRKAFLGTALSREGTPPPEARDDATAAVSALAAAHGVACVRVHDVRRSRDAVDVAGKWNAG